MPPRRPGRPPGLTAGPVAGCIGQLWGQRRREIALAAVSQRVPVSIGLDSVDARRGGHRSAEKDPGGERRGINGDIGLSGRMYGWTHGLSEQANRITGPALLRAQRARNVVLMALAPAYRRGSLPGGQTERGGRSRPLVPSYSEGKREAGQSSGSNIHPGAAGVNGLLSPFMSDLFLACESSPSSLDGVAVGLAGSPSDSASASEFISTLKITPSITPP